jgi:hypothetical protein
VTKWYLLGEGSDSAIGIRDRFVTGGLELAVPTLLFYDVMNALRFSRAFLGPELTLASR